MNLYLVMLAYFAAVVVTVVIAILTGKNVRFVRSALSDDMITAQTANSILLNICLLVTWIVALQACVDVAKGALLGGVFGVFAFYFALAALLLNRIRHCRAI